MTHTISPVAAPAPATAASPKVDIGIVTIRDDEFRAVLAAFPDKVGTFQSTSRAYTLRYADAGGGERYRIAVLRLIEQGQGEAQDAARDLIDDLGPRLVLVVGIAGGRPSSDVKLGDVVVSTRIHDFTVEARKAGEPPAYAVTGGPIDKALAALVANLPARDDELGDWTAGLPVRPPVSWTQDGQLYGPPDWQRELRDTLEHHHGPQATPRASAYAAGAIASSDRLVKDPELLILWLQTTRSLLAIEMESGGVYRAARERCPMLAIRGISDIVGLKRADAWTQYACASAAAFTRAFLRTRPIELASAADEGSNNIGLATSSAVPDRSLPAWLDRSWNTLNDTVNAGFVFECIAFHKQLLCDNQTSALLTHLRHEEIESRQALAQAKDDAHNGIRSVFEELSQTTPGAFEAPPDGDFDYDCSLSTLRRRLLDLRSDENRVWGANHDTGSDRDLNRSVEELKDVARRAARPDLVKHIAEVMRPLEHARRARLTFFKTSPGSALVRIERILEDLNPPPTDPGFEVSVLRLARLRGPVGHISKAMFGGDHSVGDDRQAAARVEAQLLEMRRDMQRIYQEILHRLAP